MYKIYLIINEHGTKLYIGFTRNIERRMLAHRKEKIRSTKNFKKFRYSILENVEHLQDARKKEMYWKSAAGRRRLKKYFI